MSRASAAPGLRDLSREFLTFLRYNRNVSPHTLRAYETDVSQFLAHLAGARDCPVSELTLSDFHTDGVRGYLTELHDRGNTRASSARRLAAVRAFAKYLVREERLADDPTALVGAAAFSSAGPLGKIDTEALPGTSVAGSAVTLIVFPRSTAGSKAPQTAPFAVPAGSFMWDRRPPRPPGA